MEIKIEEKIKEGINQKKPINLIFYIVILIIIALVAFFIFKPKDEVNAPIVGEKSEEVMGEFSDIAQQSVTEKESGGAEEGEEVKKTEESFGDGVQVIEGDGFRAVITPVENSITGPKPVIREFTVKLSSTGSCIFHWNVDGASECSFINIIANKGVENVGDEGNMQTSEKGSYQIQCIGSGGMTTNSETLICQ